MLARLQGCDNDRIAGRALPRRRPSVVSCTGRRWARGVADEMRSVCFQWGVASKFSLRGSAGRFRD
eukprot:10453763-Lingulodinium_polyedra.AAC.1